MVHLDYELDNDVCLASFLLFVSPSMYANGLYHIILKSSVLVVSEAYVQTHLLITLIYGV